MSSENSAIPVCPEQQILRTSQGNLSFRACGEGETLIFLHGILGSSKAWPFQYAAFSPRYRVMAWDAPGYADSVLVPAEIDAFVQMLHEWVQHCGAEKVSLVGHSMGGTVASRYAARYPERVKNLVLSCTHPGYGAPESAPSSEKLEKRLKELAEIGREAYGRNRARDLLPFPDVPTAVLDYAADIAAGTNLEGLRRATRMLQLADNRPLLPQLKMPTLILTGEKDAVVQPQLKADLLALVPYTQHIEMPGMGHAPYFQAPDYYNTLLHEFFAKHS
ncbi:alpha/beta fold hydrolase [Serratia fonticola]|uniref:alpha/beta fold hydrolase n=1 Tax=Serratia fonticola TaxID=47917 RepID=UPI000E2DD309|nr:alpha/beta hydrolase [Serratia fonticola]RDL27010.1 pimeloyl-ACP methyl ester carboxylesterase [Serratia fonticola]